MANDLKHELEKIFDLLEKEGMLAGLNADRDKIIDQVMESISTQQSGLKLSLDDLDLRDSATRQKLCLALVSESVSQKLFPDGNNPNFDCKKLLELDDKKLKEELKKEFLTVINVFQPDEDKKFSPQAIDELAEKCSEKLTEMVEKIKEMDKEFKPMKDPAPDDPYTRALENLFGGIDPHKTGGIQSLVTQIVGNMAGIVDQNGDNALSNSFLDSVNRYDAKPDPLGIENAIKVRLEEVSSQSLYESPRPPGPGQIGK